MSRRTRRAWEGRPPAPAEGGPMDRAYVERWLAFRWDQYRHRETNLRSVWFWVSWWLSKRGITPVAYALFGGIVGSGTGYLVWALLS